MLKVESLDSVDCPDEEDFGEQRDQNEAALAFIEKIKSATDGDSESSVQQSTADARWKVTRMAPAVRDPNRVNVFINGKFDFSLEVAQVVDLGVKVGQHLTVERLKELRQASEFGKLYQRSLEWVITRPHSLRETRDYLKRRKIKRTQLNRVREREGKRPLSEFDDAILKQVFERLVERGYLDDLKFAKYYVENRYVKKGISQKRLRAELIKKGVSNEIIAIVMGEGKRDEKTEIQKAIAKKSKRYKPDKLMGYLMRQGFDYQLVKSEIAKLKAHDVDEFPDY